LSARRSLLLLVPREERGGALVELAIAFPILMVLITGVFSFSFFLNQYIQVTDAVNVGAKLLAVSRGNTLDPCSLVSTAVTTVAPSLNSGSMTFSLALTGNNGTNTYSGTSCSSTSNTTGSAGDLVQGNPVKVTVTYPCSITVVGNSLVPGCTITAALTEIEQ
jgi:Flp pilus assembly protein TadG